MQYSKNYGFYLPSRDGDDIADINQISDNFRIIDNKMKDKQDIIEIPVDDFIIDIDFLSGYDNESCFIITGSWVSLKYVSGIDSSGNKSIATVDNITILKGSTIQSYQSDQYEFNFKISGALTDGSQREIVWFRYNIDLDGTTKDYTSFYLYKESVFLTEKDKTYSIGSYPTNNEIPTAEAVSNYVTNVVSTEQTRANNTFANALKGTASGSAILIDDVSPITHDMGVKVKSKNLLPYPYAETTKTKNGVTFTDNGDGTITANGTATNLTDFILAYNYQIRKGMLISGSPDGQSFSTFEVQAYLDENNSISSIIGLASKTDYIAPNVRIRIRSGATLNNVVFKPQIEFGTIATDYTPFVPDLTKVKVKKCGKNLFDKSIPISNYIRLDNSYKYLKYYVGTGTNVTVSIAEKPTAPNDNGFIYVYPSVTPKPRNAKWLAHQTSPELCNQQQTVVSIDGYVCLVVSVDRVLDYYGNSIQIELGSTATDYEPYKECAEYTPTADGTVEGVTSLYPNTTLTTDTGGIIIDCEYNRDISKAFAELQAAIISLGGNV